MGGYRDGVIEHDGFILAKPVKTEVLSQGRNHYLLDWGNGIKYLERNGYCRPQDCLIEGDEVVRVDVENGDSVVLTKHAVERSELFFPLGATIKAQGKAVEGARVRRAVSMPDWQRGMLEHIQGGGELTEEEKLDFSRDFGKPHTQITNTVLSDGVGSPRALMLSERNNSCIYVGGRNADDESLLIAFDPVTGVIQTIMMTDLKAYFNDSIVESLYENE